MTYPAGLSERHVQILELAAEGLTNREIGQRLFLAEDTIRTHMQIMRTKTGIGDRTGLVAWGFREGVLKVPPPRVLPAEAVEMVALARRIVAWADMYESRRPGRAA